MKRFFCLFLIPFFLSAPLLGDQVSLAEMIDIALKNNPKTQKAWANTKRAQAALGIAKGSLYPHLEATGAVMHGREVKFPNGPNTNYTFYSGELSLSYLLYDFGERGATIQATREALKAANWMSDFTMQEVVYKVFASYYEYLNAVELLRMKECTLSDAQLVLGAADDMHKAGLQSATDLSTSRAEVAHIQMDVVQQKARVAISYGRLLTSLGMPMETVLQVETQPEGINNPRFSEGIPSLIALADEQRADLLAQKARVSEMHQLTKRASRAPLPKIRALGQTGWLEYTRHQGKGYNYNAGVAVDVPIFKGFEYMYRKRLAIADEELSNAELIELQDAIALEVLTFSESLKAAQEAFQLSCEYLDESGKSYDCSMERYKAGLQSIFDLIQAQRLLADARIRKTQAYTQWLVSLAELAFATGSITK